LFNIWKNFIYDSLNNPQQFKNNFTCKSFPNEDISLIKHVIDGTPFSKYVFCFKKDISEKIKREKIILQNQILSKKEKEGQNEVEQLIDTEIIIQQIVDDIISKLKDKNDTIELFSFIKKSLEEFRYKDVKPFWLNSSVFLEVYEKTVNQIDPKLLEIPDDLIFDEIQKISFEDQILQLSHIRYCPKKR
jgi:hypothetical protein